MNQWFNRALAKRRLIGRYNYLNAVNKLLEEWTTHVIMQGGSQEQLTRKREDLVKFQREIAENKEFIKFLKSVR